MIAASWERHRARIPFGLRVALRRAPALVAAAFGPSVERVEEAGFSFTQTERSTPLSRQGTRYEPELQAAKEHNVRQVAARLDGVVIPAGGTFSWHAAVGPPVRARGFVPGPELHDGRLAVGGGGGACQAANLLAWLAFTGGLEVVERHRHALDLFPDHDRTAPFGSGATVFWPHRDLKLRNPHPDPVRLSFRVEGGELRGALQRPVDRGERWELVETDARFVREGEVVYRENTLSRRHLPDGPLIPLAHHRARVTYEVP